MGSASMGPLAVCVGNGDRESALTFIDATTFKPLALQWGENRMNRAFGVAPRLVRASADGSTFTLREGVGGEPHTVGVLHLRGLRADYVSTWNFASSLLAPSADGQFIYTSGGIYTSALQPVSAKDRRLAPSVLPAHAGNYFIQLEVKGDRFEIDLKAETKGDLAIFFPRAEVPFARLTDLDGICRENVNYGSVRDSLTHDKRILFIAAAHLIVSIPRTNDQLILHRFDPDKALEKSDLDYLFVTSEPKQFAVKGTEYRYPLIVKSKKGGVTYKLESGPKGMELGKDGVLKWAVPADFADADTDVIISVGDSAKQEVFHNFKLNVGVKAAQGVDPALKKEPEPRKGP
jgi:hypothetical protein